MCRARTMIARTIRLDTGLRLVADMEDGARRLGARDTLGAVVEAMRHGILG
jgi:hypothetical protein